MSSFNPHWANELLVRVYGDPNVSGLWGFEVYTGVAAIDDFKFDSGLVYQTEEDAKQAGDDATHIAWRYQGHCWE